MLRHLGLDSSKPCKTNKRSAAVKQFSGWGRGAGRNVINFKQMDSKDDKAQSPSQGVGSLLRASRSRLGEDLRSVAQNLRIRHVYLEAIEESRFADLPGATYAVGFVRAYAEYLGLDGHEVVRRFKEEYSEVEKRPDLVFPVPVPERSMPTGAILLVSAILALAAYGGWYVLSNDTEEAEQVPTLPQRLQSLLPGKDEAKEEASAEEQKVVEAAKETAPTTTEAAKPVDEKAEEKVEETQEAAKTEVTEVVEETKKAVAEKTPEPKMVEEVKEKVAAAPEPAAEVAPEKKPEAASMPETTATESAETKTPEKTETPAETTQPQVASEPSSGQTEETASATEPAATEPAATEPAAAEGSAATEAPAPVVNDGPPRVEIRASEPSWIQVRDEIANTMIVTRLLRPGDSYKVPNRKGLSLMTGNAGVLEIVVDGDQIPALGAIGTVLRRVMLDGDKLKSGTAIDE